MANVERGPERKSSRPPSAPWDRLFSLGSKLFVYGLLFALLYVLRPFFLLLFLTFVFAYILEHGVQGLAGKVKNRTLRVVIVAALMLGSTVSAGAFLVPALVQQGRELAHNFPTHLEAIDKQIAKLRKIEFLKGSVVDTLTAKDLVDGLMGVARDDEVLQEEPHSQGTPSRHGAGSDARAAQLERAIALVTNIASPILAASSAFLLALLFSFLLVLDLPKVSKATRELSNTKLSFFYDEVADSIRDFGVMLGRALEAQLLIAVCNTLLTAIGLYILGLSSNLIFLCAVVFFCSFIPVAGVFISSTPICVEALAQADGGISLMLMAIALITIIHFIEAYVLNPKIFGQHLRMNAVMVLIVLTIAGKLFGVWGLVLGLPVVNYFYRHAIRYQGEPVPDVPDKSAA